MLAKETPVCISCNIIIVVFFHLSSPKVGLFHRFMPLLATVMPLKHISLKRSKLMNSSLPSLFNFSRKATNNSLVMSEISIPFAWVILSCFSQACTSGVI